MSENSVGKERIWITMKSRMEAENRFRKYEYTWHILLCIISLFIIGVSIFSDKIGTNFPIEGYNIVASTLILSITLIVFGFQFGEKAAQHRECYLKLQKLWMSDKSDKELQEAYSDTLNAYPNHSEYDYQSFIVKNIIFYKKPLKDADGSPIKVSFFSIITITWFCKVLCFWMWPTLVFLMISGPICYAVFI